MFGTIVLLLLLVLLAMTWPTWPYSRNWGYLPSSAIALLIVVVRIIALSGVLALRSPFSAP